LGFETCLNLNLERFDGLEILSPGRENLGFETCPNLNLGGSTVWNPGSKRVEEDNLRLQICSSLKSGGLTVRHLNPNASRGVIWDLETIQISNRVIQRSRNPEFKHVGDNLAWVTTQVSNRG
jgi:hypothetical protein